MSKVRLFPVLVTAALLSCAKSGHSADNLNVGFVIEKHQRELIFNGTSRDTDIDTLQLHWYERLLSHLDGGLTFGYLDISQVDNPIAEGRYSSGEFLEIGLRAYYYRGDTLSLSSGIAYRYSQTNHSEPGQDIEWRWHQSSLDLQGQIWLGDTLELIAGVSGTVIDGEERASGTINQLTEFKEKNALSYYVASQISLDRTGRIGIKLDTGSQRGGRIYFQRWF